MFNFLTESTQMIDAEQAQEVMQEVVENPNIIKNYINQITPAVVNFLIQLVVCIIIFFVGTRIIKTISKFVKKSMERGNAQAGAVSFVTSLVKYSLDFVLVMLILSSFGLSGTIVAVLGSAGLTVGLALQGSLASFAGGVLLVILKPFVVGDYIIDHSCGKEGTVTEITIFYTKLLTIDNKVVLIPNGTLSNATLTNVSHMDTRRVDMTVSVSYDSDISKVKQILFDIASTHALVLKDEPVDVYVDKLADSSIDMGLRVWVKSEDYFPLKWELTEQIKNRFDQEGINIPFPQMDVHITREG